MGAWVTWVKLWRGVVWFNKVLVWIKKKACVENFAWVAWTHKFLAWVGWVYKIGLRPNFVMGLKNALCQSKMEWVGINIFQAFMVSMSCYFIILYRNYCFLCKLSRLVEAGEGWEWGSSREQLLPPLLFQYLKTLKSAPIFVFILFFVKLSKKYISMLLVSCVLFC